MSIHVCKCEHNGRTEYHLRYPGITQDEAQALADRINGGELVGADHPVRKDAARYRFLRDNPWPSPVQAVVVRHANAVWDATIDAAMLAQRAVGAA